MICLLYHAWFLLHLFWVSSGHGWWWRKFWHLETVLFWASNRLYRLWIWIWLDAFPFSTQIASYLWVHQLWNSTSVLNLYHWPKHRSIMQMWCQRLLQKPILSLEFSIMFRQLDNGSVLVKIKLDFLLLVMFCVIRFTLPSSIIIRLKTTLNCRSSYKTCLNDEE